MKTNTIANIIEECPFCGTQESMKFTQCGGQSFYLCGNCGNQCDKPTYRARIAKLQEFHPLDATQAQSDRQRTRTNGKYSKGNQCECCKKPVGFTNYYSDERCNSTGLGVCLCKKCATKLADVSDAEYLAAFKVQP
jgi:hypothetical protein